MATIKSMTPPARASVGKVSVKSSVSKPVPQASTRKPAAVAKAPVRRVIKSSPGSATKVVARKSRQVQQIKVVRDSFTMPQNEYEKIAEIKEACLKAGMPVKKSEVLRAGLKALASLKVTQLRRALADVEKIKTGRPKKD